MYMHIYICKSWFIHAYDFYIERIDLLNFFISLPLPFFLRVSHARASFE